MSEQERCCNCEQPTGRAGRADDSLYLAEIDAGPFCWECWSSIGDDLERGDQAQIEKLKADLARLREELRDEGLRLRSAAEENGCLGLSLAALRESDRKLREALTSLSNNVAGMLGAFEPELRDVISNTNFGVLKHCLANADAALARRKGG